MPLLLTVDTLDSVPEALRGEYAEKDGKFHLNVEGLEDTSALKTALATERNARKQLDKDIAAWKKLGKTPDEIAMLTAAAETAAQEAARKAGDFDGILKQHTDRWNKDRTDLEGQRDSAFAVARKATVDVGLANALTKGKATAEGMAALPQILSGRVNSEFTNGEFVSTIMQPDGKTPMIGSGDGGRATYDDLITEAKKAFPSLFEGTGAGGGGKPSRDGGGSANQMTKSEFDALSAKEKAAVATKPGFKIING